MGLLIKNFFAFIVFIAGIISIWIIYSQKLNGPVIRSDGDGYYAYLPAVFIYKDLTLNSQVNGPWHNNPPLGIYKWKESKNFITRFPCGMAIMLLPFFMAGWLIACISGVPVDGYSPPFQYAVAMAGFFYCIAGLMLLWNVLRRYFKETTVLIVLSVLLTGTNLFHYATYDATFSHIYSFFLFSAFLYITEECFHNHTGKNIFLLGITAGLIVITRPTNVIWLIMALAYGVSSVNNIKARLQSWSKIIPAAIPFALVIFIQLAYWKAITGSFIIYSYDQGEFNFASPELFNVLFSVRKGLFFWSPILLTVIPGIYFMKRKATNYFVPGLIFLILDIYIISSWDQWWYGGSLSQRPFTEATPLFAIALGSFYESVSARAKRVLLSFLFLCSLFGLWIMLKYWYGSLHSDHTLWPNLVKSFFNL